MSNVFEAVFEMIRIAKHAENSIQFMPNMSSRPRRDIQAKCALLKCAERWESLLREIVIRDLICVNFYN